MSAAWRVVLRHRPGCAVAEGRGCPIRTWGIISVGGLVVGPGIGSLLPLGSSGIGTDRGRGRCDLTVWVDSVVSRAAPKQVLDVLRELDH